MYIVFSYLYNTVLNWWLEYVIVSTISFERQDMRLHYTLSDVNHPYR